LASLAWLSAWLLAAMVADTVAVAVEPLDDRASFAIIDACNRALGATRCVLAGPPAGASVAPAPGAAVPKQPPITRVRIALSSAQVERAAVAFEAGGALSPVRILEFEDSDPLEERYRAIGLVIAARLLEEAAAQRDEPIVQDKPPPKPEPKTRRLGFETALLLGQGLDAGDLRWGLRSRALARPFASIPVSVAFAVRLAASASGEDQPSVRWTSLGLGLQGAVPLITDALFLELHAEGALQFVNVSLEDPATGAEDSGSERRTGTIAGAQLAWQPFPFWALFIGAESSLFWPPLILEVRRAEVAKEDPLRLSAHVGQRLSF
jgi:hypothetical protein